MFQPGSEVYLDNQPSLLETVQDFVQHDIVESAVDSNSYLPVREDPLGVMEPRPGKNTSEQSLLRASASVADIYEMLAEINKRISALDERFSTLMEHWPEIFWNRLRKSGSILLALKVISSLTTLLLVLQFIRKMRK